MSVPWLDLASVLGVGLLLGAGAAALFATGIRALSPAEVAGRAYVPPGSGRRLAGVGCLALCALVVGYGVYTLVG